jgi:hypothetical protein
MTRRSSVRSLLLAVAVALAGLAAAGPAAAQDAGEIKVSKGTVHIQREGQTLAAPVGMRVRQADVVVTGADGAAGIAFADQSLLSIGPNSVLAIDRFEFDPTTHRGAFTSSLRKGTLSAVSGQLTRQSPEAMQVRTPAAILGVRGTEFLVRTSESAD